jgi:hypothetical protein
MMCSSPQKFWLRDLGLVLLLAFLFPGLTASAKAAATCSEMKPLTFAGVKDGPLPWQLLHADGSYCVGLEDQQIETGDVIPLSVEKWGEGFAIFGRERFTSYLSVLMVAADGKVNAAEMTFDQRSKLHLEASFSHGSEVYLLAYDVAYNLPSGRRRETPREVLGLYRIDGPATASELVLIDNAFIDGGIEAGVKIASLTNGFWLCLSASCRRYEVGRSTVPTLMSKIDLQINGGNAQILEIVSEPGGAAYALAALTFDDRTVPMPGEDHPAYFLCAFSGAEPCKPLPSRDIPYRLRMEGGLPRWDVASKRGDAADLLEFDLQRAGINGTGNFGENNLEGRLAWSQSYYLNGLLSALDIADELELNEGVRGALRERFAAEAAETVGLLTRPYPGLMTKRYSLDREPLDGLLHTARILKPVWRGSQYLSPETNGILAGLDLKFPKSAASLESLDQSGGMPIARVRQGVPFWADGADLPWNVRSAWIEGLAWQGDRSDGVTSLAGALIDEFLDKILASKPDKWPYATGNLLSGWTARENVSANTPNYEGDKSNLSGAHISYRSMDALAVLAAMRTGLTRDRPDIVEHLGQLVERGLLYPFVNEEFQHRRQARDIPLPMARFYARAILPWQVHNMPWALLALPKE